MKPEIPEPIKTEIDEMLAVSAQHYQDGDLQEALKLAHAAWNLIPEPKKNWNYYPQTLAASFIEDYVDLGELDKVRQWIATTYEVYDDESHKDHYTLMLEAEALYKLEQDDAIDVFRRIYEIYGPRGFKGEQRKYLELVE